MERVDRAPALDVADAALGGATRVVTTEELEAGLDWVRSSPADNGVVQLIVRRPFMEAREVLDEAELTPKEGLVGDMWRVRKSTSTPDGSPNPDRQLTLINARIISLCAITPDRWKLAGDQLFVDFDLSVGNAPPGTQLHIGTAVIELTEPPHLGCVKFVSRFGEEAMRFVNSPTGRSLRLRGANTKVVVAGTVRPGDIVTKA